jgi:hypothetical protein
VFDSRREQAFCIYRNVRTGCETHLASSSEWRSLPAEKRQVREFDDSSPLVPGLRMNAAVRVFSTYAFTTWAGTALPLVLSSSSMLQLFHAALIPPCALKFPRNSVPSIMIVSSMLEMSWLCNISRWYNPYFRYTRYFYSILNV